MDAPGKYAGVLINLLGLQSSSASERKLKSADAVAQARLDEHIWEEATFILAPRAFTRSNAICIWLTRVARNSNKKGLLLVRPLPTLRRSKRRTVAA